MKKEYNTIDMEKLFTKDERPWSEEDYKQGLRVVLSNKYTNEVKVINRYKIENFPIANYRKFFEDTMTKGCGLIPFRVFGLSKSQEELDMKTTQDSFLHTFTFYNKHAYMSTITYEMSDTQVAKQPFVQVSLERFYSRKKDYGSKLLSHMIKTAKKHGATLTVWCENEKLKEYYMKHGFDYHYKSLATGHYFLTYNLQ